VFGSRAKNFCLSMSVEPNFIVVRASATYKNLRLCFSSMPVSDANEFYRSLRFGGIRTEKYLNMLKKIVKEISLDKLKISQLHTEVFGEFKRDYKGVEKIIARDKYNSRFLFFVCTNKEQGFDVISGVGRLNWKIQAAAKAGQQLSSVKVKCQVIEATDDEVIKFIIETNFNTCLSITGISSFQFFFLGILLLRIENKKLSNDRFVEFFRELRLEKSSLKSFDRTTNLILQRLQSLELPHSVSKLSSARQDLWRINQAVHQDLIPGFSELFNGNWAISKFNNTDEEKKQQSDRQTTKRKSEKIQPQLTADGDKSETQPSEIPVEKKDLLPKNTDIKLQQTDEEIRSESEKELNQAIQILKKLTFLKVKEKEMNFDFLTDEKEHIVKNFIKEFTKKKPSGRKNSKGKASPANQNLFSDAGASEPKQIHSAQAEDQ
jgi:hypothetical protein